MAAAVLIMVCVVLPQRVNAQGGPVAWSLKGPALTKPVRVGSKFSAQLSADIGGGWHLYSLTQPPGGPNPTRVAVPAGQPFKLAGAIKAPRPTIKFDENFQLDTESYSVVVWENLNPSCLR